MKNRVEITIAIALIAIITIIFAINLRNKVDPDNRKEIISDEMQTLINSEACLAIDTFYSVPDSLTSADSTLLQKVHLDSLYGLPEDEDKVSYIFIHCTATPPIPAEKLDSAGLMRIFHQRGWDRSGYQFFIDYRGKVFQMVRLNYNDNLDFSEMAWGASGYNDKAIHISYAGGVDSNLNPKDTRTPQQALTIVNVVKILKQRYPNAKILPHSAVSAKACPSFDVYSEFPN